jgi:hypothetical protein
MPSSSSAFSVGGNSWTPGLDLIEEANLADERISRFNIRPAGDVEVCSV